MQALTRIAASKILDRRRLRSRGQEPILADSQDLNSSQLELDNEDDTSGVVGPLQEQLQTSIDRGRERFNTSSWVARQVHHVPTEDLSPGSLHREQGVQEGADDANASWLTQATAPWGEQQQQGREEDTNSVNASWNTQATISSCPPSSQYPMVAAIQNTLTGSRHCTTCSYTTGSSEHILPCITSDND